MEKRLGEEWRILGETVRGASHERNGMPNQDAFYCNQESGSSELPIIMAVSDGHGGAKYFRSDIGALLAVSTTAAVVNDFLDGQTDIDNLSIIKKNAEEWLPKTLVRRWREAVDNHIENKPITEDELSTLEIKHGSRVRHSAENNLTVTYGATLLIAVVTNKYFLFMQLGDGDILAVSGEGEVQRPLPTDERLMGNDTTSLCSQDAWGDFRIGFQPVSNSHPALLLLSTDGYANCFLNDEGFKKVAADIYHMIQKDGISKVEDNLKGWLIDASRTGSGDDITVGIICHMDAFDKEVNDLERTEETNITDAISGSV